MAPLSADEISIAVKLGIEAGLAVSEIAARAGVSAENVRGIIRAQGGSGGTPAPARPEKTRRPCLCCGRPFWSAGAHNRICGACKDRARGYSPLAEGAPLRLPGDR